MSIYIFLRTASMVQEVASALEETHNNQSRFEMRLKIQARPELEFGTLPLELSFSFTLMPRSGPYTTTIQTSVLSTLLLNWHTQTYLYYVLYYFSHISTETLLPHHSHCLFHTNSLLPFICFTQTSRFDLLSFSILETCTLLPSSHTFLMFHTCFMFHIIIVVKCE